MAAIEIIDRHVVYENPHPQNRSRHGYFPGLVKLPSGDLLALFVLGEAFEAANGPYKTVRAGYCCTDYASIVRGNRLRDLLVLVILLIVFTFRSHGPSHSGA